MGGDVPPLEIQFSRGNSNIRKSGVEVCVCVGGGREGDWGGGWRIKEVVKKKKESRSLRHNSNEATKLTLVNHFLFSSSFLILASSVNSSCLVIVNGFPVYFHSMIRTP